MDEKRQLLPYAEPIVTVTHFGAGDCISTSDMAFESGGSWSENIPGGGWT